MNWRDFWRLVWRKLSKYSGYDFVASQLRSFRTSAFKARYIFLAYFVITFSFSLLLYAPFSQTGNSPVTYLDSLFTSASAFSDTGLVTLPTFSTWTMAGQALIAILILLGGLGVFALKIFIINYLFKVKSSHSSRDLVNAERGSSVFGNTNSVIINSLSVMTVLIFLFGLILSFYFYYVEPQSSILDAMQVEGKTVPFDNPVGNWSLSFRFGFFHTVSAINNAGFDIVSGSSLLPYYNNYSLQIIFVILFVIGGIGYPVINDVVEHLKNAYRNRKYPKLYRKLNFTLFTKISLIAYFSVAAMILVFTYSFEINATSPNAFWNKPENGGAFEKSFALFFNATATRSAGFSTANLGSLSPATLVVFSIAMFIGAAPSSTGGGIRTTTLAIIIMSIWARLTGRPSVRIFKRKLPKDTVYMSYIVAGSAFFLVIIVIFINASSLGIYGGAIVNDAENTFGVTNILFEVTSAFGTTGLSTGITASLNTVSKIALIFTMFIGQLGITSTISSWRSRKSRVENFDYLEEGVAIG